jgi:proteasome assembly chaperone (PAC2) family protein
MENGAWLKRYDIPTLEKPVAIVGSPGLRSVGKLVVDSLIAQTNAQLIAELYSTHLPSIYETKPAYSAHPAFPGEAGAIVELGVLDLPKVQFYACSNPALILTKGYHPNFDGQFVVAEKVVDFLSQMQVKRMIVAAGYGSKEKNVCCAATNQKLLTEMKEKYDLGIGYKGPFMGFSGLVFGLTKLKEIEAVCLFGGTQPTEDDLELPDKEAADRILAKLKQILNL